MTVVQHFDTALRQTPYDVFVERIRARSALKGFLMTPDAAFGYERRGTPETLAALGDREGFEVVVVPPFDLGGRPVRSSEIRTAIAEGDLGLATALLGRPVTLTGWADDGDADHQRLRFALPTAVPPDGTYAGRIGGADCALEIRAGEATIRPRATSRRVTVELLAD